MASFHNYKNKSGAFWEYRILYKDPISGKKKEKSKKGFPTKAEAKKAAELVEADLRDGIKQENVKLKDYIYQWLNSHKKPNIQESTYLNKKQQIDLHIVPFFQEITVQEVSPVLYQKFIDQLAAKGYSKSTVGNNHWIAFEMFDRAIKDKIIKFNPAQDATIKGKQRADEDELQYIDSRLIPDLLRAAYKESFEYYIFFKTLIETGMRKGEAAGLTWEDLDFDENLIKITKSMDTQHGKSGKTKTYSSKRTIDVLPGLMEELKELKKEQRKNRMRKGEDYDREANLVFCREDGRFYPKSTLFNAFRRYQKAADINAGLDENKEIVYYPIHALRHSHAVICLENGVEMFDLQNRLGHKNYEITANVYSHVSPKMRQNTINKIYEGTKEIFKPIKMEEVE
jgi:integrase